MALGMFCHKNCIKCLKMVTDCPSPFLGTFSHKKWGSSRGSIVLGTDRYKKIEGTDCHGDGSFGDG
jgi:hypothetical protein